MGSSSWKQEEEPFLLMDPKNNSPSLSFLPLPGSGLPGFLYFTPCTLHQLILYF